MLSGTDVGTLTGASGLAYRSKPKPRKIVARMKAEEKKYGDETPSVSNDQPKKSGAIARVMPPYVCCIPM